jgi:hypothetical protein
MSTMTAIRYRSLCRYAGDWIERPIERSFTVDDLGDIDACSGVYVVCEPLERVHYVGSVHRPANRAGVADRLREHLRAGHKRLWWKTVWVLPLKADAPRAVVRSVEACVGRDLDPLWRGRLPAL